MGYNVKLILPTESEAEANPIIGRVVGAWQGCTITPGFGWGLNKNGKPVRDRLLILRCTVPYWDKNVKAWWRDLAEVARTTWNQASVFLSVSEERAELVCGPITREPIGYAGL